YNLRVDYNFSPKNNFFGRYTRSDNNVTGESVLATNIQNSLVGSEHDVLGGSILTGGWVHTFSSTLINNFNFGFMTDPQQYNKGDNTDWPAKLQMQQDLFPGYSPGLPYFQFGSVNLSSGAYRPLVVGEQNYQWTDSLTMVRGNHTFK